ncbi:aminoglycoside phosphotransferase (APT) family kinase protein [Motilibacter rhizosphaerae]|uniref:Aminoglycoside phosphotransferase (APT) family kinase protein n=1 Tax=Motilibacter rhizosphaerae TaxID=598652 RepID=A0A4Q7NAR9_9ACTN|nr:aminoglycoside phosphotransferase family protein [Motilibacter rhizosphaerae]RZS80009.1 aminoglycoside phosphotransferase (APT) family kinase protein [Motilibacter rhizosphaerae]
MPDLTDDAPLMHADEVRVSADLVRRLVAGQHPQWAHLPVEHLSSSGTDNAMFRLGDELTVRLPRIPSVVHNVEHEWRWLREIAPQLPVATPVPVALGEPGEGFPFPWSVCTFVPGQNPDVVDEAFVHDLAEFLRAFRALDVAGAPRRTKVALAARDAEVRECIAAVADLVDTERTTAAWEVLRDAPVAELPGPWVHGDITGGNLLVRGGRLAGVLDFSGCGLGDPAVDLAVAWNLLPERLRDPFWKATGADDATWVRSAGWALSQALIQLPYYRETNIPLATNAQHVIRETVPYALAR